ncbi:hypothetical protein KMW28_11635 [Flammeovirga yaeyamensis]|uniref:Sugar transferase n=1 Tax=Flammeovirga yaeyamensis TaxID=367791 RepID=A0AAX1N3C2_9BACT|nr:hypothetical protein [Flammeovirga yaeyamensis]MBB3696187.1 hypothetical protein [Flammeovirga yaeyamensis]NMF34870.1 glycosyltransferase family 2 protein [Flammeovirga yaeyamensis]QWG00303.1 hypothetical protein KMW28_11635 [Flammeovirga yaeyamensis]
MTNAPIALFIYDRPDHLKKTILALKENKELYQSPLYVYADGAKSNSTNEQKERIRNTRTIVRELLNDHPDFNLIEKDQNNGLANSIIGGVTELTEKYGKVIVLEDDIISSPFFLKYMNDSLEVYKNDDNIFHINSYLPQFPKSKSFDLKKDTFLSTHMSCWGWATWKESWQYFDNDTEKIYQQLIDRNLIEELDLHGHFKGSEQLVKNINREIKTWAIKWSSSILLNNGKCLNTSQSLSNNIGTDGSGENFVGIPIWDPYQTKIYYNKVNPKSINKDISIGDLYFEKFYKHVNVKGIKRKLYKIYYALKRYSSR